MRKLNVIGTGSFSGMNISLESKKAVDESQVLFIPESSGKNYALDALKNALGDENTEGKKKILLEFKMGQMDEKRLKSTAEKIAEGISEGEAGTFITIGDPGVYSTFYTIKEHLPKDIEVRVFPGISSPWAAAALIGIPLVSKGEIFVMADEYPDDKVLDFADSVAVLKTRGDKEDLLNKFEKAGFKYWFVKRLGSPEERVITGREEILSDRDYMSLIIAKKIKGI